MPAIYITYINVALKINLIKCTAACVLENNGHCYVSRVLLTYCTLPHATLRYLICWPSNNYIPDW